MTSTAYDDQFAPEPTAHPVIDNRVTEKPATGNTIWLVSAEWRGGHDNRKFLLENIYRDYASAKAQWDQLTPENHNKNYNYEPSANKGFIRHPIRTFKETLES